MPAYLKARSGIRVKHRHHVQTVNALEVRRIAGVNGKAVCNTDGRDHGVVGASFRLAAGMPQRGSDPTKGSRRGCIEGQWVEIGLCLLEMRLTCRSLGVGGRNQWAFRQFGLGDHRDQWVGR